MAFFISKRKFLSQSATAFTALQAPWVWGQADDIKLGLSAPLSGPSSDISHRFLSGASLYFDKTNAQGGVQGRRIKLISLDDGYQPERCAANAERLIHTEGVLALFGFFGTATTQAALPSITKSSSMLFAPLTGAESLRNPFISNIWHVRASYYEEAESLIAQLTQVGIDRIAVVHQEDAFGAEGLEGVRRALSRRGLALAGVAGIPRNSTQAASAVDSLKNTRPSGLVLLLNQAPASAFISAWRKQSLAHKTTALRTISVVDTNGLHESLGETGAGLGISQVVPFPYDARKAPVAAEYVEAAQGSKVPVSFAGMEGFIAAKALTYILRKVPGRPDRDRLLDTMKTIGSLDLGGFPLQFGPRQNCGSNFVELVALKGKQGFIR